MKTRRTGMIAGIAVAAAVSLATSSYAATGTVRVVFAKAGLVVGAGGGRGVLTFDHRNYRFTVQGLSVGLTAGASVSKLVGLARHLKTVGDFAGTYSVVGAGAAMVGGVAGVSLRNDKGVTIHLQGLIGGVEVSANITKVVIQLDQSRSTPD